jgi:hypothetical protein
MAVPVATQKMEEASPVAMDTEVPTKKIYEIGDVSAATQKAHEATPAEANAGTPPKRADKKMAATLVAQKAGEVSPATVDSGGSTTDPTRSWQYPWPLKRQLVHPWWRLTLGCPLRRSMKEGRPLCPP